MNEETRQAVGGEEGGASQPASLSRACLDPDHNTLYLYFHYDNVYYVFI